MVYSKSGLSVVPKKEPEPDWTCEESFELEFLDCVTFISFTRNDANETVAVSYKSLKNPNLKWIGYEFPESNEESIMERGNGKCLEYYD